MTEVQVKLQKEWHRIRKRARTYITRIFELLTRLKHIPSKLFAAPAEAGVMENTRQVRKNK